MSQSDKWIWKYAAAADERDQLAEKLREAEAEVKRLIEKLRVAVEALEYYAKELEWREVEQTMNLCSDDCPRGCNEHNSKYKSRVRPVAHSKRIARQALEKLKGTK